jgi:hypothetical protein
VEFFEFLFGSFIGILIFLLLLALYFLPTIVALLRHHRNALAIFILNFFLGGTGIGWVVALVWAVTKD